MSHSHSAGYTGAMIGAWLFAGPAFVLAVLALFSGGFGAAVMMAVIGLIALGIGDFLGGLLDRVSGPRRS